MAKSYRDNNYWESKPEVVKIFDDLEKFHDFCRFEMCEFDEANLYNRQSPIWNQYLQSTRPRKPWNGERKPRSEYNRSGNNQRYNQ